MEETIDLKNVFRMMWEKKLIIITITMIAILLGFVYSYKMVKPKYTAKVQIVLVQIDKNQEKKNNLGALTQSDVTINDKIIATYQKLLTNEDVLTQVIKNTQIVDITPAELKRSTTATVVSNTQILDIQVTNKNAEKASILANELAKVFKEKIYNTYGIDNVSITLVAEIPKEPSNIHHMKDILMFTIVGIVIAIFSIILINFLDNSIKTASDIEELGLNILAEFPEIKEIKSFDGNKGGNK